MQGDARRAGHRRAPRRRRPPPPAVSAARAAAREREDKERLGTLQLGRRVRVAVKQAGGSRQLGSVRYLGAAQFQGGWWVGVRLDAPLGRNNGSVNGVRYFVCEEGHGLFVRPSSVDSVDAPPRIWEEWEDVLVRAAQLPARRRRRRRGGGGSAAGGGGNGGGGNGAATAGRR